MSRPQYEMSFFCRFICIVVKTIFWGIIGLVVLLFLGCAWPILGAVIIVFWPLWVIILLVFLGWFLVDKLPDIIYQRQIRKEKEKEPNPYSDSNVN